MERERREEEGQRIEETDKKQFLQVLLPGSLLAEQAGWLTDVGR